MMVKILLYKMVFAVNKILTSHIKIVAHPSLINSSHGVYVMVIRFNNKDYVLTMGPMFPENEKKLEEKTSKNTINMVDLAATVCGMN